MRIELMEKRVFRRIFALGSVRLMQRRERKSNGKTKVSVELSQWLFITQTRAENTTLENVSASVPKSTLFVHWLFRQINCKIVG